MDRSVLISLILIGTFIIFAIIVTVSNIQEVVGDYQRDNPGKKAITFTNILAFIGAFTMMYFVSWLFH